MSRDVRIRSAKGSMPSGQLKSSVQAPVQRTIRVPLSKIYLGCCFGWFVISAVFIGLFAARQHHDGGAPTHELKEYDLSGHGNCTANKIVIKKMWKWMQYDAKPEIKPVAFAELNNFVGRNSLMWDRHNSTTARVSAVEVREDSVIIKSVAKI